MRLYRLTHPDYETDMDDARANPVREAGYHKQIPCMHCDVCDSEWGGSGHLRIPITAEMEVFPLLRGVTLERQEWPAIVGDLALRLGVEFGAMNPGMSIGPPRGEVWGTVANDIVHPFPGLLWVKPHVVDALRGVGATGVTYQRVELQWAQSWHDFDLEVTLNEKPLWQPPDDEPPELWELIPSGGAWRKGYTLERITQCSVCGKTWFPAIGYYEVDESRWDGSDFFNLDRNPNILMVTERIYELFQECGFSNYCCISVTST